MQRIDPVGKFDASVSTILKDCEYLGADGPVKAVPYVDDGGESGQSSIQDGMPVLSQMPVAVLSPITTRSHWGISSEGLQFTLTIQVWVKDWDRRRANNINSALILDLTTRLLREYGWKNPEVTCVGPSRKFLLPKGSQATDGPRVLYSELTVTGNACYG